MTSKQPGFGYERVVPRESGRAIATAGSATRASALACTNSGIAYRARGTGRRPCPGLSARWKGKGGGIVTDGVDQTSLSVSLHQVGLRLWSMDKFEEARGVARPRA